MNRYQFVSVSRPTADAKTLKSAKVLTNLDEIEAANTVQGEYLFEPDKELTARYSKLTALEMKVETLASGNEVNRLYGINEKGMRVRFRAYGNGREALPAKVFKPEEIAKLSFGYCTSDGETITETKAIGDEVVKVPVFYVKVA